MTFCLVHNIQINKIALSKNIELASLYYHQIFQLSPHYKLAQTNYARMLAQSENARARVIGYKKLLALQPDNLEALYQLGVSYGKMLNQLDSAVVYFGQALQLQPENKTVLRDMGVALSMQGKVEASLPYHEKVVELSPHEKANYINLGLTYQKLGKAEKAREMFEKAKLLE